MIWLIRSGNCRTGDIGGYHIDRGAKLTIVSVDMNVQKIDMGERNFPGKVDGRATLEIFKENSDSVCPMGPK